MTFEWMTADGFFAGPAGDLDWVVPDEEQARMAAKDIGRFDTALFGRRTYEMFEAFWGHAVVDSSGTVPDPHHPGRRSREHGTVATALNKITKLVFSKTLPAAAWQNSRLLRDLNPREIEAMKAQPGRDMIVFGSGSVVSQLTQHALIDEYQLVVCPIFLGGGRPLLSGVSKRLKLELLETKTLPSGDVLLRYARGR